eukprot:s747_g14.t1
MDVLSDVDVKESVIDGGEGVVKNGEGDGVWGSDNKTRSVWLQHSVEDENDERKVKSGVVGEGQVTEEEEWQVAQRLGPVEQVVRR